MTSMRRTAAAAIGFALTFAAAPLAHADGGGIAMAISDSTGQIKIGQGATQAAAEQKAMDSCRKNISDCRLLASGTGGCVAIAANASNSRYVGGWGPSRGEAEAAAAGQGGVPQPSHTHCVGDGS
jgi:hypothetical protein